MFVTNRVCKPVRQCVVGEEYEVLAPTPSTNRMCANATTCNTTIQFEKTPLTFSADRECSLLRVCKIPALEFQSLPPTPTTDRKCTFTRECRTCEWESLAPTSTSNRICLPAAFCNTSSSFMLVERTPTTDRVCAPLRVCDSGFQFENNVPESASVRTCELETTQLVTNRECANLTNCTDLQFQSRAPSATSDRLCQVLRTCNLNLQVCHSAVTVCAPCQNRAHGPLHPCDACVVASRLYSTVPGDPCLSTCTCKSPSQTCVI